MKTHLGTLRCVFEVELRVSVLKADERSDRKVIEVRYRTAKTMQHAKGASTF